MAISKLPIHPAAVGLTQTRSKVNEIIDAEAADEFGGGGSGGAYEGNWTNFPAYQTDSQGQADNFGEVTITHNLGVERPITQVYLKDPHTSKEKLLDGGWGEIGGIDLGWTYIKTNSNSGQLRFFEQIHIEGHTSGSSATVYEGEIASMTLTTAISESWQFRVVMVASGGSGGSATTTFEDDAPTSPSTGDTWWDNGAGKMYIYSGTVWVQTNASGGGSARGGGSYDTGWSTHGGTVADGAALTINHNLGTSDILVQVYLADDVSGTNNIMLNNQTDGSGAYLYDYQAQSASSSSIIIQLNGSGYTRAPSSGTTSLHYNYTSKFVRVIIHAGGNPIQYSSGWIDTDGTTDVDNAATLTINHNLGTTDINAMVFVNTSASDTNAQEARGTHPTTITSKTSNSCTLQFGETGYMDVDSGGIGTNETWANKFIKVVINASVSGEPIAQMAKSSIAFDGTSGSIGTGWKSHNVSGVTDNGTGDYTVNFINAISLPIVVCGKNGATTTTSPETMGNENISLIPIGYPTLSPVVASPATAVRVKINKDTEAVSQTGRDSNVVNVVCF